MPSPRTYAVCAKLGMHVRFLSSVGHYPNHDRFEGPVLPLIAEGGRHELNEMLKREAKGHVVVVDGIHHGNYAVFGRDEAASAKAGGARAVIVLGLVAQSAELRKEAYPIMARGTTPFLLPAEEGSARSTAVDSECGWITREHYIVGDADGAVVVERERYQAKFPLK